MNSRGCKWLVSFAVFFCLMFVAAGVAAKKPDNTGKPGMPDDPCSIEADFVPDFVFWRDSTRKRVPQVTIYMASSADGCEKRLLDIPLADTGPIHDLKLSFGSYVEEEVFHGRVVWVRQVTGQAISVWKYDFSIKDGSLVTVSSPAPILINQDLENRDINYIALSPNSETLAYQLTERFDYGTEYTIRTIDIDSCDACTFINGQIIGGLTDSLAKCDFLRSPVWGPLGQRVYVIQYESSSCYEVGSYTVKFRDLAEEDWEVLFTVDNPPDSLGQTDYRLVRTIASGIPSGCTEPYDCEYLAVQVSWTELSSCGNLHLARVNDCNGADDTCLSGPVIAGTNPSWTKNGELLHTYQGWTNRDSETNCATNMVGMWDGTNLVSLLKGIEPTASSAQH